MPTYLDASALELKQKVTHEEYAQLIKQSDVYYDPNINQINNNKKKYDPSMVIFMVKQFQIRNEYL